MATAIPIGLMRFKVGESPREKIEFLQSLSEQLTYKKAEIKRLEAEIAGMKAEVSLLEMNEIPDFMFECGMQNATLLNGSKVEIRPFYYARISALDEKSTAEDAIKREEALKWLRDNKFGGLIKENIIVTPDQFNANLLITFLHEIKASFEEKSGVHHKTLESWLKEQFLAGRGEQIPLSLFNAVVGRKAVIK